MNKEVKYGSYDDIELHQLMTEPWEVTDRPYLLHAAYALSCLSEVVIDDEEDDDNTIWGKTIPEKTLKSIVKNVTESFNEAAQNRAKIDVWGRPYTVRKPNAYDPQILDRIFDFKLSNGEYTISKEGIVKLFRNEYLGFEENKNTLAKNKDYLRKIIRLAEDDDNEGWDKLTDMEVAVYCWAQFYSKNQCDNIIQFYDEYDDYLCIEKRDLIGCLSEYSSNGGSPHGMYAFDKDKVIDWNVKNKQRSVVDEIPSKEAEDYWYDTALKTTFKTNVN